MASAWTELLSGAHPLVYLGALIIAGYVGGMVAHSFRLPRISGYIVAGMLLSPSATGILSATTLKSDLSLITDIALGIIAFSIGGTLEMAKLKKLGRQIIVITFVQALLVAVLVSAAVIFLLPYLPGSGAVTGNSLIAVGILLGSICAATAPAAVLGVIHEYRAKGPLTTVLLGVVTLDDGITLVLFSMAGGVAAGLGGNAPSLLHSGLLEPLREIVVALLIGGSAGGVLRISVPEVRRRASLLGLTLGAVFVTSGVALTLHTSPLLACMMLGFVVVNTMSMPEPWFEAIEKVEEPLLAMFFVLAGAHLEIGALEAAWALTLVVITMRTAGKLGGAYLGGVMSSAPMVVRRYLSLGLLPQAGVSIGLVLAAKEYVSDASAVQIMVNTILASVIINELISPVLVKTALIKSGEAQNPGGE